jgi:hypothetical protein
LAQSQTDTSTTPPATTAPDGGEAHHWHHRPMTPDQQLAMMTSKLQLSDIQQGQIKPILVSRDTQMKSIFENSSLSEDQKRQQMMSLLMSTSQQIESFLNPAQVAEYKRMHEHHFDHKKSDTGSSVTSSDSGSSSQ